MENPFKYGGVVRGPHFADREDELAELEQEMLNLSRVFLVSPRRYGKTCLLFSLMERLEKRGVATAYLDLNAHPTLKSFAGTLTAETSRALESNADRLIKILSRFQRLRPKVSVAPDGSLSVGAEVSSPAGDPLSALLEGLNHAERFAAKKKRKLVVVIDEFSDMAKYDGEVLEKGLRSEVQKHQQIGYIMSGSEESLILAMVRQKSRAFYKLGRIMELGPIPRDIYSDFVMGWLKRGGYRANRRDLDRLFTLGQDVPQNIQRLCHTMWEVARESKHVTPEVIGKLTEVIVRQDSPHYEMLWQMATPAQRSLLMALSSEHFLSPFSREFMLKYSIGPPSSIKASLESLMKKGILYRSSDGAYRFADGFMPHWIEYLRRERPIS